ncbi:MAG TPA: glycosyltransferase family 4 protein [Candidatus Paceibacterota bacterium]
MKVISLGLDRSVLDPASPAGMRAVLYRDMVERYEVVVPSSGGPKFLRLWSLYRQAAALLSKDAFDVVTVQDAYFVAAVARRLARRFGTGFEIQIHGFERSVGLRKRLARANICAADHVRVVSERLKRQVVDEFGVDAELVTVAPIFSDAISGAYPSRSERRMEAPLEFLFVGRLVPVKNVPLLLSSFSDLLKEIPNARLTIVGDGPERARLVTHAEHVGVTENVEFVGRQNDLVPYYHRADVFVLPSDSEGWGLVAVEAAHAGLPIVMADVGLAGEVIRDGESGLVVPPGDRKALTEAMKRLAQSPQERERLGHAAFEAARALPSKEELLRRIRAGWEIALRARRKS